MAAEGKVADSGTGTGGSSFSAGPSAVTATLDVLDMAVAPLSIPCVGGSSTLTKLDVESLLIFSGRALNVSLARDLRRNQSITFLAAELETFFCDWADCTASTVTIDGEDCPRLPDGGCIPVAPTMGEVLVRIEEVGWAGVAGMGFISLAERGAGVVGVGAIDPRFSLIEPDLPISSYPKDLGQESLTGPSTAKSSALTSSPP